MSLQVRDNIHSGIEFQFPSLYKEDGHFMVEFTKAYYKFVDQQMDRDIPKLRDIDTTLTAFLIFFKKKYLADLPLDTVVDTRFIIKHVTDLYKRKGTKESLELLFQLFYDEEIEVFYPSTNILRPSDSVWGGDAYLEMKPVFVVDDYPISKGDRIKGDISLASAFVDEIIFVNFTGSLTPVAYLSNITGKFISDDGILITRLGVTSIVGKLIAGSISETSVTSSLRLPGQKVGDKVNLVSDLSGVSATGTILTVSDTITGQIDFRVIDGGFGYVNPLSSTASNIVGVSNQVVIVNQSSTTAISKGQIVTFDQAALTGSGVSDGGSNVYGTTPTAIHGSGKVISYIHPLLYLQTNTDAQRTAKITETYTSGTYINQKVIVVEMLKTLLGTPTTNDDWDLILESVSPNGYVYGDITNSGGFTAADVIVMGHYIETHLLPALGIFKQFNLMPVNPTNAAGDLIPTQAATFKIDDTATAVAATIGGFNESASYEVASITDTEYVTLITDQIGDYVDVVLSSSDYLMSGVGQESLATTLKDAFTPLTVELGAINEIKILSTGNDYESDVYSNIEHTNISKFDKRDVIINFTDVSFASSLRKGDKIQQIRQIEDLAIASQVGNVDATTLGMSNTTGAYPSTTTITKSSGSTIPYTVKAKFIKRDGNDFYFRQLTFYDFVKSVGINISNNIYAVESIKLDPNSLPMGNNAEISGIASYQTGQVESVATVNSGYRYTDNEILSIVNYEPLSNSYEKTVGNLQIRTLGAGATEGTWKTSTSFLSEKSKKLHDNFYYQEYSYEVSSIIDPSKYEPLIRDTIGVAGTKVFSAPLINSTSNVQSKIDIEFEVYDISEEDTMTEDGVDVITTQSGADNLVAVIVTLDEATTNSIKTSIGT
jgi:hypothetical protein